MNVNRQTAPFRIEKLLRPASVAVIGAGTEAGRQVIANLQEAAFRGTILPVDPGLKCIAGMLVYARVEDLPLAPDLAVVATAPDDVGPALLALGAGRCHAALVTGPAPGLARMARQSGVRVLGPGSFGIAVPAIGLNATRSHLPVRAGKLALVSQSASLCRAVIDWAEPNGVGFSHVVGIGGNADLGFRAIIDWLSRDHDTGAILLDVRHIKNRAAFLSAARAAARLRPVVAIRAGSLLDDPSGFADATMEAAFRRAGVLSVSGLQALLAAAETLSRARPARSEALAIVTNASGLGRMAADAALRDGLKLAALSEATRAGLALLLPDAQIAAGLVHTGPGTPIRLAEIAAMLSGAPEIGGILVALAPTGPGDPAAIEALAACAPAMKLPLLACIMGQTTAGPYRRRLAEAGLPVFSSPEQAVQGFFHLVQSRRNKAAARELPPRAVLDFSPDLAAVRALFAAARDAGRLALHQQDALAVLTAYGIPVVPSRVAHGVDEAVAAAELLKFPVVLTPLRDAPPIRGKAVFGLRDADAVRRAATRLAVDTLVQRQVGRAQSLLIRVAEDPMFGPAIVFSSDDRGAAPMRGVAVDLPPLNLPLAHALIARSPDAALLDTQHDRAAANIDAVAETLVRVSQLVVDFPEIAELTLDPLFADADGVLAADAWLRLHRPEAVEDTARHLAIPPYPAELSGYFSAKDEKLLIRAIRPEDAEAHAAFFRRLAPEDIRFRFFSAMRELSAEQMARMTQVDYTREMAFVAVREATGETVGVCRLVNDGDAGSGEFAVIVEPSMKGRGLARHLMQRLIDWAPTKGMTEIMGLVLADNAPMLAFVRRLGFRLRHMPDEPELVQAVLSLQPAAAT